ncbi:MAG: ParB-like protein [Bacteriovoracia bacterium]
MKSKRFQYLIVGALTAFTLVRADDGSEKAASLALSSMRPTRLEVRLDEVAKLETELREMDEAALAKYFEKNPLRGIRMPDGVYYVTDGHRLAVALSRLGKRNALMIVDEDYSELGQAKAYERLEARHLQLKDSHGHQYAFDDLPKTFKEMRGVGEPVQLGRALNALKPSQFEVDTAEVARLQKTLEKLDEEKLAEYLKQNPIPVVWGPGDAMYVQDKHELAYALMKSGKRKARVIVQDDWSGLKENEFYERLTEKVLKLKDSHGYEFSRLSLPDTLKEMRPKGEIITMKFKDLRPTQFKVGLLEIDARKGRIAALSEADRRKYLAEHPVQVIIGPGGEKYLVDGHHLSRALVDLGETEVQVTVLADWSEMAETDFWEKMQRKNYVLLRDSDGKLHTYQELSQLTLKDLKDDPYRSLAWLVRKSGGYDSVDDIAFQEFRWAEFLREHVDVEKLVREHGPEQGWLMATQQGLSAATSDHARKLPGYRKEAKGLACKLEVLFRETLKVRF